MAWWLITLRFVAGSLFSVVVVNSVDGAVWCYGLCYCLRLFCG